MMMTMMKSIKMLIFDYQYGLHLTPRWGRHLRFWTVCVRLFSPLFAPFPLRNYRSIHAPSFSMIYAHAPLPLTRFSARSDPFSTPLCEGWIFTPVSYLRTDISGIKQASLFHLTHNIPLSFNLISFMPILIYLTCKCLGINNQ